jgi:nitroreductase/NAD-dependent dihydropyrimidine dehydrogenase PreA subunit
MLYEINEELCRNCGLCMTECHIDLQGREKANPDSSDCSDCGHCFSVCPEKAIICRKNDPRQNDDKRKMNTEYCCIRDRLWSRRSHRIFKKKDVPDSILEKIVNDSTYVPSGGNSHSYEFTVIRNHHIRCNLRDEIMKIYENRGKLLKSRTLKAVARPFVDKQTRALMKGTKYYDRIMHLLKKFREGEDIVMYDAPVVMLIHSKELFPTPKEDAVLVGYNINLLAEAVGLGCCYMTIIQYALNASRKCRRIAGLGKDDIVHAVLVMGYPERVYKRTPLRPVKKLKVV